MKLLNVSQLSEAITRPERQIRSFVAARKIPYLKLGHKTILFDLDKVCAALAKFEVPAVGDK